MKKGSVLIVGGGIAGLCSAFYLLKSGWDVTLVDKHDLQNNCSHGNAGMIVPSHFIPLAAPGMVSKGIRWMFDKKSPFYIRPAFSMSLFNWGWKFLRYSTEKHVNASAPFIKELNLLGRSEYIKLKDEYGLNFPLENKGILMLYKNKKTAKEQHELAGMAQEFNLDCEVLDRDGIQALEPALKVDVIGGVHYRSDSHINPSEFMKELIRAVEKLGCTIVRNEEINRIEINNHTIKKVLSNQREFEADQFVFSTGANLNQTLKRAGINLPMLAGKGYSFMSNQFEGRLQHPALLLDDKVSITPMNGSVRIGGTMELGVSNDKINRNKVLGISQAVGNYYPDVKIETPLQNEIWKGFRPCSPDGLPYLGRLKKLDNVVIAGGGGMMGVSCGPAFGKIVSELIGGKGLSMDIEIFNPERFQ